MNSAIQRAVDMQRALIAESESLEALRKKALLSAAATYAVLAVGVGFAAAAFHEPGVWLIGLVLAWLMLPRLSRSYTHAFKAGVMGAAVAKLGDALQYRHQAHLGQSSFAASGLFPAAIKRYRGEDLVWGRLDGVELGFSELRVTFDGGDQEFRGLFLEITRTDEQRSPLLLLPCTVFGEPREDIPLLRPVTLDAAPELEASFQAYARTPQEAQAVLTPARQAALLDFRAAVGGPFRVAFQADKIYVALPRTEDMFEPALWRSLAAPGTLAPIVAMLVAVTDLAVALGGEQEAAAPSRPRRKPRPVPAPAVSRRRFEKIRAAIVLYVMGFAVAGMAFDGVRQVIGTHVLGGFAGPVQAQVEHVRVAHVGRFRQTVYRTRYRYEVEGRAYRGMTEEDVAHAVGSPLPVRYAAASPGLSVPAHHLGDKGDRDLWALLVLMGIVAFGLVPTVLLISALRPTSAQSVGSPG